MIKNYFKTAFRNLWRNKNFSLINIIGLAAGIAVCIIIFLIITFELSFDEFHPKKDRIFRVLTASTGGDGTHQSGGVPYPLPTTFRNDFAGTKSSAVYSTGDDQVIITAEGSGQIEKKFKEGTGFFYVEPTFFEIFNFPLLAGDYKALKDPNTCLITKETAERYFDDWKLAIGRTIKHDNHELLRVAGVLASIPAATDFQLKIVASYATLKDYTTSTDWQSVASNHNCYVMLAQGTTEQGMDQQLETFKKKYYKPADQKDNQLLLQPLSMVHYSQDTSNFLHRTISKSLINTLWLIAAFILLIACVNFVNLSTAQAINRAKEVGVRKVMGSSRAQLKFQFFSEITLITLSAIIVSIALVFASLPYVSKVLKLPLHFDIMQNPVILLFLLAIAVVVILLAGSYPAIVLSRFNPITALKSKVNAGKAKGISLRRGLVVFQFVIAQALIIGTLIIVQQMNYFQTKSLGFDKEAIINVGFPDDSISKTKLVYLKNKLKAIGGVKAVSLSFASPADFGNWSSNFRFNHADKETDWSANLKWADEDYVNTYTIPLAVGRNLNPSDTIKEFIVNETLVKRLGLATPAEALNKDISMWDDHFTGPIVGVVKDFNANNLKKAIGPLLITTNKQFYSMANIKVTGGQLPAVLESTKALWNEVYPDYVYDPQFLDAKIASFYSQESKLASLYKMFAILAIFLSCLGLYGLASFMAAQRIKEVGIRKVLGASVSNIVLLFSKEFLVLIGIAFLIAAPLAWFYMHDWLQDFVYRIHISWWILLSAGLMAIVIAMITISFKAIRAASANPVKSLRAE